MSSETRGPWAIHAPRDARLPDHVQEYLSTRKRNLRLLIAYQGTEYGGWQRQPGRPTVQGSIEEALERITQDGLFVRGASRTDAGVHARGQVAHVRTKTDIPAGSIRRALNSLLPRSIVIRGVDDLPPSFHAQYDAKWKSYEYVIRLGDTRDPFSEPFAWQVEGTLDSALMRQSAQQLLGEHDFRGFSASDARAGNTVRTLHLVDVWHRGLIIKVNVAGDGFLHHMVRIIVGTLVEIGRGRMSPDASGRILETGDRNLAGPTAPAKALYLSRVAY